MRKMQDVLAAFPKLDWKVRVDDEGNGTAYAVLGGDRGTGEVYVLAVIQNAAAPRHLHQEGAAYGEKIGTFAGSLHDRDDDGRPVVVGPDDVLIHGPGTVHAPSATFWFGYYHQPRGSLLIADPVEHWDQA